jgi:hypothetical protein
VVPGNWQKVLFYDTAERVANFLRPHWSLAIRGQATIVQALPDMMEILPVGASKGAGVQMLLDHMEVPIDQVRVVSLTISKPTSICLSLLSYHLSDVFCLAPLFRYLTTSTCLCICC